MPWLIKPAQLDKFRKNQKNLIILDATWHLNSHDRDAAAEFVDQHIPGARFLNLNEFHQPDSAIPNMLIRDEDLLSKKLGQLGITADQKIIFYDNSDLHTSCRALWMLKVCGHNPHQLYILDGGLKAWLAYGGKIETGAHKNVAEKKYSLTFEAHFIRTLLQMKTNLHHPIEQVIDLRHAVRYAGGKELRSNLRSGHIPKSYSFPYMTMFENNGSWKDMEKIQKQLQGIGVDIAKPIVTMCGSGMTAAILNFALDIMNQPENALYDGSWSEWGSNELYHGEESIDERPALRSVDV